MNKFVIIFSLLTVVIKLQAQHFDVEKAILYNVTFQKNKLNAKYQNLKLANFESSKFDSFNEDLQAYIKDSLNDSDDDISLYIVKSIYEKNKNHIKNALFNATYAFKKSNIISNTVIKNNVYFLNGYLLYSLNAVEKSLFYLQKCTYPQSYLKFEVNYLIANCYKQTAKTDKAIDAFINLINTSKYISVVDYQKNLNEVISISEKNNDDALALMYSLRLDTLYNRVNQQGTKKVLLNNNIYYNSLTPDNVINYLNTQQSINNNNIGLLYRKLGDYKTSEKYFLESIKLLGKNKNNDIYPNVKTNIGLTYMYLKKYAEADENLQFALSYYIKKENLNKQAELNNIIAKNDFLTGNSNSAISKCNASIALSSKEKDYTNLANSYFILSEVYAFNNDFQKSQYYYKLYNDTKDLALNVEPKNTSTDKKVNELQGDVNDEISTIEKRELETAKIKLESTQKEQELLLLKKDNELKEKTLVNQQLEKEQVQKSLALIKEQLDKEKINNEYLALSKDREKKLLESKNYQKDIQILNADKISYKREGQLKQLELDNNKKIQRFLIGGLSLLGVFLGFIVFAFYKNNKQKSIISNNMSQLEMYSENLVTANTQLEETINEVNEQKHVIEEKNNQILDSINYSSRIQNSLFVNEEKLNTFFNDSFVINLPRDIVSGDFYLTKQKGSKIYVAVVDCTGHGVPGSLISIIGYQEINHILDKHNFSPAKILHTLNKNINNLINTNAQVGSDGMDVMLLEIDTAFNKITYAGARGFMSVFSDGILTDYKGDRNSIGEKNGDELPVFNDKVIKFNENDIVYLYSDGFLDQFSDIDKKRIGTKTFKTKLESIKQASLTSQKNELISLFNIHKGNAKQTDDVTVLGLKLKTVQKTINTVIENPRIEELLNSISQRETMRNNLMVIYGTVNQEIIISTIKLIEKKLITGNFSKTIITKVKMLSTEILQNISKHQTEHQTIYPYFIIGNNNNDLNIISGNVINEHEKNFLANKLPTYKALNREDLKKEYLETFSNSTITNEGNAGLGLLTILYRSDQNIEHDIVTIDEDLYHFNFEVIIKTNSNN